MTILYKNNAYSTMAGTGMTNVATTLPVQTGHGDRFPVVAAPDVAYVTVENNSGVREIMKITARASGADSMTVVRAQEGTTAQTWSAGDVVEQRITAGELANFETLANVDNATSKATPVDGDYFPLKDSAAGNALKYLTWANLKATFYAALGALIAAGTSKTTPVSGDSFTIADSAASNATKTLTLANLLAFILGTANTWSKAQRGAYNTLTDGATVTPDFSLGNMFRLQLGGNRTLANPTNLVAGQSGCIDLYQDSTGSRTLAYQWGWQFAGGTAPTLTTAARAKDKLSYSVDVYAQATVTITIAAPGVVSWTGHGLMAGQQVQLTTTGALPTGLTANTTYYVVPVDANSFQLSATQNGSAITTTGTQSGVHTMTAISITGALNGAVK